MMPSRPINTRAIIADIQSGLGDIPIMEKYQLSPSEYLQVLDKLLAVRAITETATQERKRALLAQPKPETVAKRKLTRNYALFTITIQDADDLSVAGSLNDITEKGLQISGLRAQIGDEKNLLVRSDVFSVVPPLLLRAVCRWIKPGNRAEDPVAGFEITAISRHDIQGLRKLITELTISPSNGQ
jgi:hypothetical protein